MSDEKFFDEVYKFLFDRTRQIRQELYNMSDKRECDIGTLKSTIQIFEKIVRLHIIYFNEGLKSSYFKHDN